MGRWLADFEGGTMVVAMGSREEVCRRGMRCVRRRMAETVLERELVLPPVGGVGLVGLFLYQPGFLGGFSFLVLTLLVAAAVVAAAVGRGARLVLALQR